MKGKDGQEVEDQGTVETKEDIERIAERDAEIGTETGIDIGKRIKQNTGKETEVEESTKSDQKKAKLIMNKAKDDEFLEFMFEAL